MSEHLVHASLDCWILSQKCRSTLTWHTDAQPVSAPNDAVIAGRDELWENANPLQGSTLWHNMVKKGFMYWKHN